MRDNVILPPHTREDFMKGIFPDEWRSVYVYRKLSPEGKIISEIEFEALITDPRQIMINDAIFDIEDNIILSAQWFPAGAALPDGELLPLDIINESFFFFNRNTNEGFRETENMTKATNFIKGNDGNVIVPTMLGASGSKISIYYKIDFENANIIEGPTRSAIDPIITGVFTAPTSSEFDYYLLSQTWLYGFVESEVEFIQLTNLGSFGVGNTVGPSGMEDILFWDDGRISVVISEWDSAFDYREFSIILLTPSDEPWFIERETITLGGIDIGISPLAEQAMRFNRHSLTHQIEIVNYTPEEMARLRTELVAGQGPDIIKLSWANADFVEALSEYGFLLDLYPLIESDNVLQRDDFFSSVLSTWENNYGELIQIAPNFTIMTTIGHSAVLPHAPEAWTYADLINFYNNARANGYLYPMGQTIDRLHMLDLLLFADDTFFSSSDGVANFNSESFLTVLEFVKSIPAEQGWESVLHLSQAGQWDPINNLLIGEQLLIPFQNIHNLMHFRNLQFRLGGLTAFGFPALNSPVHVAQVATGTSVGIRSNSPHIEAAWEFVRMGLTPRASSGRDAFPIRVDHFEQIITAELNRVEPITMMIDGISYEMPPMTQEDVILLRDLIDNIGHSIVTGHPVQLMIREDVNAFFSNKQSAEDTARIIQSRVGIYLAENVR